MGCTLTRPTKNTILCRGKLQSGEFTIDGGVSSQFITGLLIALPLAMRDTSIEVHGAVSTPYIDMTIETVERFGVEGAFITKATAQLMRDFGAIQSPQNAFLLNLGLESLHVRMARHCENGLAVAKFLKSDDRIAWVTYPSLEGDKYYDLAEKYMPQGTCGVVSFGVKGGREMAERFMGNLKIAAIETHVADARTCCLHPASATHRQMNEDELVAAGISGDLVRLSCGIENADDLIEDIKQALDALN